MSTLSVGVQSKDIICDDYPIEGFELMKRAGFSCCDFSLNAYITNRSLYALEINDFFDQSIEELEKFFAPHKEAAKITGIQINQMHMPPNLPKLLYIGFKLIPQIPYKIGV